VVLGSPVSRIADTIPEAASVGTKLLRTVPRNLQTTASRQKLTLEGDELSSLLKHLLNRSTLRVMGTADTGGVQLQLQHTQD
jgi:hypothetical protein